jgi:DNA-binding MarR family transcriptional regulator
MQQLQNASDPLVCAESVIEAVLDVILLMRETTAHGQGKRGGATLIHIRAMGTLRKRPGATLSALSAQLALTLSATSRLVHCLVAKGYVARRIPEGNRRTVALHLTPAGARVHARARDEAQRELALLFRRLSPARRAALTRSMECLRRTIEDAAKTE